MFWDGDRWIDERAVEGPPPTARRSIRPRHSIFGAAPLVMVTLLAATQLGLGPEVAVAGTAAHVIAPAQLSAASAGLTTRVVQESSPAVHLTGRWRRAVNPTYSGGRALITWSRGATARITFTGRAITLVGPRAPWGGRALVTIDGRRSLIVTQRARSFVPRAATFRVSWASDGRHTVTVKSLGSPTGASFTVDAFKITTSSVPNGQDKRVATAPVPTATATPVMSSAPSATPASTVAPSGCGASLQAAINAAPAGSTLDLTGCSYTAGATISKALTLVGATVVVGPATRAITIAASSVTLDRLTITGAQHTAFVPSTEIGIYSHDAISNVVIRNTTVSNFGQAGMWLNHVTGLTVTNNTVTDVAYAGIMVLSGAGGIISGNVVKRVGMGATATLPENADAYGIALSQENPSVDPPTADFTVTGNSVADVPSWHAFDTHGGQRITWTNNLAAGSRSGFFITGGAVRALDNDVNGNTVDGFANSYWAITSVYSTGGYVRNNTIASWPAGRAILTTSGSDPTATAVDLTISGNSIVP